MTRLRIPGKLIWLELSSRDPTKAKAFYADVFGWRTVSFPVGGTSFDMIFAGETPDTMLGTWVATRGHERSRWSASVSVADLDDALAKTIAGGGSITKPADEIPSVGSGATIRDPGGAELALIARTKADPPDAGPAPIGRFFWLELHTPDPGTAAAFYAAVIGFSRSSLPSPAGAYHILSSNGVDRAGITSQLAPGEAPYWLPYVRVDDVDATCELARARGANVVMAPNQIRGVGRVGIFEDPTGAIVAVMKPRPRSSATS